VSEAVSYAVNDNVATLSIDDGKVNAFNHELIDAVTAGLDRALAEAGAVVVTGRNGVLSAGFDLKVITGEPAAAGGLAVAGGRLLLKMFLHPQPLLVAASGHAIALGALMLLVADYRAGARGDYKIGLNEIAAGLSLPTFALEFARQRLDPRHLPLATLGAQLYAPEDAVEPGYLDAAVPADELAAHNRSMAAEMGVL
jgi:enoyl-CoA hydratase